MSDVALTARQFEILVMAAHHSNREIAHELGLSHRTVKNVLNAVYRKLGITGHDHKRIKALWAAGVLEEPWRGETMGEEGTTRALWSWAWRDYIAIAIMEDTESGQRWVDIYLCIGKVKGE